MTRDSQASVKKEEVSPITRIRVLMRTRMMGILLLTTINSLLARMIDAIIVSLSVVQAVLRGRRCLISNCHFSFPLIPSLPTSRPEGASRLV